MLFLFLLTKNCMAFILTKKKLKQTKMGRTSRFFQVYFFVFYFFAIVIDIANII